ncbi:MAG: hypothetical protein GQ532_04075 [Methylomarinum sp.]|nr:hypothetical protein [Methylomarinum sp.]
MKTLEFLELVSVINQLDHHQRTILVSTLTQLSDEPKVSELIENAFDAKNACPYCAHIKPLFWSSLTGHLQLEFFIVNRL